MRSLFQIFAKMQNIERDTTLKEVANNFHIYKNIQKIHLMFNAILPIFIVISNETKLFCAVTNYQAPYVYRRA